MQKILFVCTANIFRSRFSEEVYNHLAANMNLSSQAFSAGLMVGHYKTRTIYAPALRQLNLLNISNINFFSGPKKVITAIIVEKITITNVIIIIK